MADYFISCCFTGYRPSKFPFDLKTQSYDYTRFENKVYDAIFSIADEGCYTFYSGMAMGFDLIAAEAVLLLRESYQKASIKLICAIPFAEQAKTYESYWKAKYEKILAEADETVILSDKYCPQCFQVRNEYMVDNSNYVITWFDGQKGGTKNTIDYARRKNLRIVNLWFDDQNDSDYAEQYQILTD